MACYVAERGSQRLRWRRTVLPCSWCWCVTGSSIATLWTTGHKVRPGVRIRVFQCTIFQAPRCTCGLWAQPLAVYRDRKQIRQAVSRRAVLTSLRVDFGSIQVERELVTERERAAREEEARREAIRAQQQELEELEVERKREEEEAAKRRREEEARQLEQHFLELQRKQQAKMEEEERKKKDEEDQRRQQQLILGKGRKKMSFSLGFKM
ncbi:hypothetical protein Vretifemale_8820 [Volvox reticuliferus]|uniref:Uncharacterized protein n=1 Tax=Volvox reticuliferus TaxID=1737510 RepID=A0A8J4CBC2_9CHLO|nr:hypothetical protein Vretifemale_8820 [Volvox reticuliferus]